MQTLMAFIKDVKVMYDRTNVPKEALAIETQGYLPALPYRMQAHRIRS